MQEQPKHTFSQGTQPPREVTIDARAREIRLDRFETRETVTLRDSREEGETHVMPLKRVLRDKQGRLVAFAEWEYAQDKQGIWHFQSLTVKGEGGETVRVSSKRESNSLLKYEMHGREGFAERLVRHRNGMVVSVHDIRTNDDGTRVIVSWMPKRDHDKTFWKKTTTARLGNKEEEVLEEVSLHGPFGEGFGVLWPDARGERVVATEPQPWAIAWDSVDPSR
jgi:hypothetical protein